MRELQINEINTVAGGSLALDAALLYLYTVSLLNQPVVYYEPYVTSYDVVSYDPFWNEYVIDTYYEEHWVPSYTYY